MNLVKIDALVPGMVVSRDIYNQSGLLIVSEGTKLTSDYIQKLLNWNFTEIYVEEPSLSVIEQQEAAIAAQMSVTHDRVVGITQNILSQDNAEMLDPVLLQGMVGDLNEQIDLSSNVLLNLSHMKTYDNYLFAHSVNVCVLSLIIGRAIKLSAEQLRELGLSALLHDYGMIQLERSIYDHDRKLTNEEWEKIKSHPRFGYDMLLASGNFSEQMLSGVLEHHEREDGSGYPDGKTDDAIGLFGKIIAVADVYDACVSMRKHRPRLTPHEALRNLLGNSHLYDLKILKAFITAMAIYPIGSIVKLNSGEVAKVVGINYGQPFRPDIRILIDRQGNCLEKPIRLNLNEQEYSHTYIQEIMEGNALEEIYALLEKNGVALSAYP